MSGELVRICGIGVYLPEEIRTNEAWPEELVAKWKERAALQWSRAQTSEERVESQGATKTLAGISRYASDPFRGTRERRVMSPTQTAVEMEAAACEDALQRAGLSASDIDVVMGFSLCPDYINVPNACSVHRLLGLRSDTLALDVSAVCNSFQAQLFLAEALIKSGGARHALLVQSSPMTRMEPEQNPQSAWFGDGATAVVLGPADGTRGVLASVHRTDGSVAGGVVHGVPGARWYDDGKIEMYSEDPAASRSMLVRLADQAKDSIGEALELAGLTHEDVAFYAGHQSTAWMQPVTAEHAGLSHARTVDTFSWAGTLSAANIPLALSVAEREGLLAAGDVVALFSPGTGMTWSATVMRW